MAISVNARLRETRAIRRGYVDTPGGQVHYAEAGTGRPLVLIHQARASWTQWSAVMPYFADSCRALSPDLPGHGESYVPLRQPLIGDYARWVVEFMDALGIERADILGFHVSASIALEVAVRYPDRVDRLLLSGLPDYDEAGGRLRAQAALSATGLTYGEPTTTLLPDDAPEDRNAPVTIVPLEEHMADVVAWDLDGKAHLFPVDRALLYLTARLQAIPHGHWMLPAVLEQRAHDLLPNVTAPTLFFWAANDAVKNSQPELAALVPNATTAVIDQSPKMPMDNAPEQFAQIALDFLTQRETGR